MTLEKVARAICFSGGFPPKWSEEDIERHFRQYRAHHMQAARAAIEALMEPDDAMIEAARRRPLDQPAFDYGGIWKIMLTTILNTDTTP